MHSRFVLCIIFHTNYHSCSNWKSTQTYNPVLKLLTSLNHLLTARVNQQVISPCIKNRCRDHRHIHLKTMSRLTSLNYLLIAKVNQQEVINPCTKNRCRDHQHIHCETMCRFISVNFTLEKITISHTCKVTFICFIGIFKKKRPQRNNA